MKPCCFQISKLLQGSGEKKLKGSSFLAAGCSFHSHFMKTRPIITHWSIPTSPLAVARLIKCIQPYENTNSSHYNPFSGYMKSNYLQSTLKKL